MEVSSFFNDDSYTKLNGRRIFSGGGCRRPVWEAAPYREMEGLGEERKARPRGRGRAGGVGQPTNSVLAPVGASFRPERRSVRPISSRAFMVAVADFWTVMRRSQLEVLRTPFTS